jgi:hypothetical protein
VSAIYKYWQYKKVRQNSVNLTCMAADRGWIIKYSRF